MFISFPYYTLGLPKSICYGTNKKKYDTINNRTIKITYNNIYIIITIENKLD